MYEGEGNRWSVDFFWFDFTASPDGKSVRASTAYELLGPTPAAGSVESAFRRRFEPDLLALCPPGTRLQPVSQRIRRDTVSKTWHYAPGSYRRAFRKGWTGHELEITAEAHLDDPSKSRIRLEHRDSDLARIASVFHLLTGGEGAQVAPRARLAVTRFAAVLTHHAEGFEDLTRILRVAAELQRSDDH